jgi:hypothetical protein
MKLEPSAWSASPQRSEAWRASSLGTPLGHLDDASYSGAK